MPEILIKLLTYFIKCKMKLRKFFVIAYEIYKLATKIKFITFASPFAILRYNFVIY